MACASHETSRGGSQSILQLNNIAAGKLAGLNGSRWLGRLEISVVGHLFQETTAPHLRVKETTRIALESRTSGWLLVAAGTSGREGIWSF